MSLPVSGSQNYKNITGTTTVFTGAGSLDSIFVASSSSGTLKIQDGSTTIVNTFSAVAATSYRIPARFGTSLIVTTGGTIDCTVFWGT